MLASAATGAGTIILPLCLSASSTPRLSGRCRKRLRRAAAIAFAVTAIAAALSSGTFVFAIAVPRPCAAEARSSVASQRARPQPGPSVVASSVSRLAGASVVFAASCAMVAAASRRISRRRITQDSLDVIGTGTRGSRSSLRAVGDGRGHAGGMAAQAAPVWVINLDQSVERWEHCQAQLLKRGVVAERFPATPGKSLNWSELVECCSFGARYFCTAGMIGCFVSHRRAWQRVVDEALPAAVVLEDDVILFQDFAGRVQDLLPELPADWDVCLLGAVGCIQPDVEPMYMKLYGLITGGGRRSPGRSRRVSENIYVPYRPAGTHAYVVSNKGARRLLDALPKVSYHVDVAAWALQDLRLYAATPVLAAQRFSDDSTVSKGGAALTQRFLHWCWRVSGLAAMGKRAGIPENSAWAWKIAVFALPLPGRRRIVVEMGPASALFVLMAIASMCTRSLRLAGLAMAYMSFLIFVIRWLAGTQSFTTMLALTSMSAALLYSA